MPRCDSFCRITGLVVVSVGCGLVMAGEAAAQAGDTVDGAVWRFGLERIGRGPGPGKLRGAYRINNFEMFQRESESFEPPRKSNPQEWTKKVGGVDRLKGKKGDKTVVWTITDILVFDEDRRSQRINGTIRAQLDERGHWSGEFIDGDGRHWKFSTQRIKE